MKCFPDNTAFESRGEAFETFLICCSNCKSQENNLEANNPGTKRLKVYILVSVSKSQDNLHCLLAIQKKHSFIYIDAIRQYSNTSHFNALDNIDKIISSYLPGLPFITDIGVLCILTTRSHCLLLQCYIYTHRSVACIA